MDRPLPVYSPKNCPGCNGRNTLFHTSTDYPISIISSKGLPRAFLAFEIT